MTKIIETLHSYHGYCFFVHSLVFFFLLTVFLFILKIIKIRLSYKRRAFGGSPALSYMDAFKRRLGEELLESSDKNFKEEQKRQEEVFQTLAVTMEQSPACIVITDLKGNIQYVNSKFVQLTGYSINEVLGQNPRVLKSGEQPKEFYTELWDTISSGREWRGEFHNRKKNGDLYWEKAYISPIRNKRGEIISFIAIKEDVTEAREAREALEKLKIQNELILNFAGEGIVGLDKEGNHYFVNNAAAKMFGYSINDLIGKNGHDTWHYAWPDGTPFPVEVCPIESSLKDGVMRNVKDEVFWRKDGSNFPVEYTSSPIQDSTGIIGIVVVFRDITERRLVEGRLAKTYSMLKAALDNAPFGVYVLDSSGKLEYVNSAMLEIEGKSREEFTELSILESNIYKSLDLDKKIKNVLSGEYFFAPAQDFMKHSLDKGTIRNYTGIPIETELGRKALIFVEDITEQKRLERLRDDFISTVSHELRTPLAITREGIALLLEDIVGKTDDQQKKLLSTAQNNIDRLTRIINSLLDSSKLEAHRLELKCSTVNLKELILQVAAVFEDKIKAKYLNLELDLPANDVYVYADADRLTQVFINLISNSLKFTAKGFIKISLREKGNELECCVEDSGIGLTAENLEYIFDKFRQFNRVHGEGERGTGLGLYIVKGIIELHKGNIWAESEFGRGTKLCFILPKSSV